MDPYEAVVETTDGDHVRPVVHLPVLIVEDVDGLRGALARVFMRAGYSTVLADDGHQAMQVIRTQALAAAVVDRHIPGPDGIELLAELQELQPDTLRVLVSGELDLSTALVAINQGHVDHVFQKPVRYADLLEQVGSSLERSARVRAAQQLGLTRAQMAQCARFAECIDQNLLDVALQPIVDVRTGVPRAYEALLRSRHPVLSNPGLVLAAAEGAGRIPDLTRVVVREASRWFERVPVDTELFLNLHPLDLGTPEVLLESLAALEGRAHRVVLEITERSALGEGWQDTLPLLREAGFRIAVDDAGAGYSSLATIAEAEPEVIKVDMSIIRDVDRHPPRQLLLRMLAAFAQDAGVQLIAEGVETVAEAESVVRNAPHAWVQGYHYGKPTRWSAWPPLPHPSRSSPSTLEVVDHGEG